MNIGEQRVGGGGIQKALDYLEKKQADDPSFLYSIQTQNHSVQAIFWADSSSRVNYASFGDTVVLHASSIFDLCNLPFLYLAGFNHHGHPLLFGCGLLLSPPSPFSLTWFFQVWLQSMSRPPPLSLTTDLDPLLQPPISHVFPQTRHRFSFHSVFEKTRKQLANTCRLHPSFEADFRKCVKEAETAEEFESFWGFLLERYNLRDDQWLVSIYGIRQHWVPVFLRGTFLRETERSFLEGFIYSETTVEILLKKCEEAVEYWKGEEVRADYELSNSIPELQTSSPMEKQAAVVYTRHSFSMFQRELVGSLGDVAVEVDGDGESVMYRVPKLGKDGCLETVRLIPVPEMKVCCSCLGFESSGVVCRHILAVFRARNVLCIPHNCILKRWTRNGRGDRVLFNSDSFKHSDDEGQDSLEVRYDHLWNEATRYVELGARSVSVYSVAMKALREGTKKVCAVNNLELCEKQCGGLGNGGSPEMHQRGEDERESRLSRREKWKKIQELRRELEKVNQRSEVYRANLAAAIKTTHDQNMKLFVKVHNSTLSFK